MSRCTIPFVTMIAAASIVWSDPVFAQGSANKSFVEEAAYSNRFEIEAAKLVLEKGKDPAARQFAQDMIDDHSKSLSELERAAQAENIRSPTELDPESTKKILALKQAPPADFDQAYLSTQVAAHEKAVALFMAYSKNGPDGLLKNYAANTVGTLRTHAIKVHGLTNK